MDLKAFLESGTLELYAMDALSPQETRAVEASAEQHPEVKARIGELQEVFFRLALASAVEPPPYIKGELMEKIGRADRNPDVEKPSATKNNSAWRVASLLGALLLTALVAYLYFNNLKLAARCDENQKALQQQIDRYRAELEFITQKGTQPVALKGTPLAPDAAVTVYWNSETRTTLLAVGQLPPAPSGRQYQLWSLRNGQPKSAGLLALEPTDALQTMENVAEADMFAITEEPAGGVESPTLDRLVAAGNVASVSF